MTLFSYLLNVYSTIKYYDIIYFYIGILYKDLHLIQYKTINYFVLLFGGTVCYIFLV